MPGPTAEILNEDVKDLKAEIREIRIDVHRVDISVARIQTEFGFAKWLVGFLLVATASGIGSGIDWAGSITADVRNLVTMIDKVEQRFDKVEQKFDHLEQVMSKILEQTQSK